MLYFLLSVLFSFNPETEAALQKNDIALYQANEIADIRK